MEYLVREEVGRASAIGGQLVVSLDDESCYHGDGKETGLVGTKVREGSDESARTKMRMLSTSPFQFSASALSHLSVSER